MGIGTNSPNPKSVLDLTSTSKGFLPPRMTNFQKNSIVAPLAGLQLYCTDCSDYGETQVYNGFTWTNLCGSLASGLIKLSTVVGYAPYNITISSATMIGNVTNDGYTPITARGICWSTSTTPTILDAHITNSGTKGVFTSTLTGLSIGTTYYVRTFATNNVGTSYGYQITFSTLSASSPLMAATTAVSAITTSTASSGGTVSSDGNATIIVRGVCWNTAINPTTLNSKSIDTGTIGAFSSNLTGLSSGTKYYVRAYATNSVGTSYGTEVSFTTQSLPTITVTAVVTAISGSTATSGGTISAAGTSAITARGICWSASTAAPTTANFNTVVTGTTGAFVSGISGISSNTLYYVRAYATNSLGTSYGPQVSFTTTSTSATAPTLSATTAANSITASTASSGGTVSTDGGALITARGVCWSTSTSPTIANAKTIATGTTGAFTSGLTGLSAATLYYVRVYATNTFGTTYGTTQVTFTTLAGTTPVVAATTAATLITQTTATSGGNITNDGGIPITARGVCWNTAGTPTISDSKTTDSGTTGSFIGNLTGILPGTAYSVRAYATNSLGTTYGTAVSFTASAVVAPILVATTAASAITFTTASSGGSVTNDGGATINARGICWSNITNPTILNSLTNDSGTIGSFTSELTGLTKGVLYYIRSYAANSAGTSYGTQVTFRTTSDIPALSSTTAVTSIGITTAISGAGNPISNGISPVTALGVCWSTVANPTIANSKTDNGTFVGAFSSNITGLTSNTLYYVRAYATNDIGTGYGNELSFTTQQTPITICDGTVPTTIVELTSTTGKIWMDRNLGASQTAISNNDYLGYGCLYQWGRGNDGHASINWSSPETMVSTESLADTDAPGNDLFIINNSSTYDWRSDNNNTRWQTGSQVNNPCPTGFYVPSDAQITAEITAYGITNNTTAYTSIFKFVTSGSRNASNAKLSSQNSNGSYWTSSINGTSAIKRYINSNSTISTVFGRANGASVRCIKQ